MSGDLLRLNAHIRAEADDILWKRGLHAVLEAYGQVQITGSYALQVMVWRDLDLYLVAPDLPIDAFFELGRRIARLLRPPRMHFRDERIGKTPDLPRDGVYWGIYLGDERTGTWKIDLWGIGPAEHARLQASFDDIACRLTQDARLRILRVKSQCWHLPGYRSRFTSRDIYRAVLDRGVADRDGFDAYIREIKGYGIEE